MAVSKIRQTDSSIDVWYENCDSRSWGKKKRSRVAQNILTNLGGEEVPELGALVPADVLVVHVHLPEPPHHRQLEVLIVNGLVGATGEGEAVGDLKPRVGDQAEQRSLGDPGTRGGGLELVAVLDQLHDHQAVDLDNLR